MCSPSVVLLIVYVHACVVQYMTWTAWAAYEVYMSACACTYVLYLYHLYSVLAWTAWAMHRFLRRPACLGSHAVLVHVQLMAWIV